jgi:hypothetical protein
LVDGVDALRRRATFAGAKEADSEADEQRQEVRDDESEEGIS